MTSSHVTPAPTGRFAAGLCIYLGALPTRFPVPAQDSPATQGQMPARHPGLTLLFWICALASMLYSVVEGTFSNWAIVFLTEERGLTAGNAALASPASGRH